ncbi:MAG: flavin reductase family protein [Ignavibacteria bacterium]|nr:flavin reductase family protein [Ignavibacteria bacterium]
MTIFDPRALTKSEIYYLLTSSVVPRPIALVTTRSDAGVLNAAPFSFFNAVSSDPPTLLLAIDRRSGKMKDTSRNIIDQKEYVVNVVTEEIAEAMNITSATLPRDVSEISKAGFTVLPSVRVSVPRIAESHIHFECILSQWLPIGNGPTDLILGEILMIHVDPGVLSGDRVDPRTLRAVGRLSGSGYCRTTDIFEMRRPP